MRMHWFNEQLVRTGEEALARVRAGVAYLDAKHGPGWDALIDIDRLKIESCRHCILAQLNRQGKTTIVTPWYGLDIGITLGAFTEPLMMLGIRPPSIVRSYELLTAAWKAVLRERRGVVPAAGRGVVVTGV